MPDTDRTSVLSILLGVSSDGDRYVSQTGEIAGVLKQLTDETTANLNFVDEVLDVSVMSQRQVLEIQQVQKIVVDVLVVLQRQEAMIRKVKKAVEVPQVQHVDEILEVPVVVQCQAPTIRIVKKTVEARQVQFFDRVMDVPVVMQRQTQERIVADIIDVSVPHVKG